MGLPPHLLLDAVDNSLESFWVVHRKISEDFAVKANTCGAETVHKTAVSGAVLTGSCVDTGDPEAAESTLLVSTVAVGVSKAFFNGVLGYGVDLGTCAKVSFGGFKNALAARAACNRIY